MHSQSPWQSTTLNLVLSLAVMAAMGMGCGKKKEGAGGGSSSPGDAAQVVGPKALADDALGVAAIAEFNYLYGKGDKPFAEAKAAYKKKDWAAVKAGCEATLAKDPTHLDARRLLGSAFAQLGNADDAVAALSRVIAADPLGFAPGIATDPDLAEFRDTAVGQAFAERTTTTLAAFQVRAKAAVPIFGRRSTFKWPNGKTPKLYSASRGELIGWDREKSRFLRLSHTNWSIAGVLGGPTTDSPELAYVAYSQIEFPESFRDGVFLHDPKIGFLTPGQPAAKPAATLKGKWTALELSYASGGELVVRAWPLDEVDPVLFTFDRTANKLKSTRNVATSAPKLLVDFMGTRIDEGVPAEPPPDGVNLPKGLPLMPASVRYNVDKDHVVLATGGNPCEYSGGEEAALYVVSLPDKKLKHLVSGVGVGTARWLSRSELLYEDDQEGLRVFDTSQGKDVATLTNRGGLALDGLGAFDDPTCREKVDIDELERQEEEDFDRLEGEPDHEDWSEEAAPGDR
jgi:hypothetical protein